MPYPLRIRKLLAGHPLHFIQAREAGKPLLNFTVQRIGRHLIAPFLLHI
ncbi:hypothetical protein NZJ93_09575 [Desulfofundulus thermocisternus]|nr:hypothetical protein [Desulfofundulus thermocisternus]